MLSLGLPAPVYAPYHPVPTALFATNRVVPVLDLGAGDHGMIAQMGLRTPNRTYSRITDALFVPAQGSDRLYGNVTELLFKADLNGLARDGCEATIAKAKPDPESDLVHFRIVRPTYVYPGRILQTQVLAYMGDDLSGQHIGVECAEITARDLRNRPIPDSAIVYNGASPTLHTSSRPRVSSSACRLSTRSAIRFRREASWIPSRWIWKRGGRT